MSVFKVAAFSDEEDTAEILASTDSNRGEVHIYQILGTWTGVITFEVKSRSVSTWVSVLAANAADGAEDPTTTANGLFRFLADGLDSRARFSTDGSGSPQVWRTQRQL